MGEEKLVTTPKNFRLPEDVLEILRKTAEETGQTETQVICTLLRVSAEDAERVLQRTEDGAIQLAERGGGAIQVPMPRDRDGLADAITTLMYETQERIAVNDRISALGVARARVYKLTPEYQERKGREGEKFWSPYENEKELAEKLSKTGGAGDYRAKMREKGDK